MFIESEVGHDQGGAPEYFKNLGKRLSKYIKKYKDQGVGLISIAIVSNAPRRLSNYIRENRGEVARLLGLENILEGYNFFVIPSMMLKEVLPAVLVRTMGAIGLLAPKA